MKKLFTPDHAGHGLTEDESIFMGGARNEVGIESVSLFLAPINCFFQAEKRIVDGPVRQHQLYGALGAGCAGECMPGGKLGSRVCRVDRIMITINQPPMKGVLGIR